jgi:squalene-hopene/tetraprenyl-beta-curcumene cyclase
MSVRPRALRVGLLLSLLAVFPLAARAADEPKSKEATGRTYEQAVNKAINYLATKGQAADGSFTASAGPAVTALVATSILRQGRSPDDPVVAKALKYVERFVHDDGGIYNTGSNNKNYETCIAVACFNEANRGGKYDALLKKADAFIKKEQWGPSTSTSADDIKYGGAGYGRTNDRPDLSNTSFLMDALKATGNSPDSDAVQRALVFVSRCQNLESPNNTTPFAAKIDDGGFYYTPAAGGSSQAGTDDATGGLRSYGSMTYAGLKSMIYAGLTPDDERVKAAIKWLEKHYSVDANPGMPDGKQGLFYYYHAFAKALAALGQDTFTDDQGKAHDWRSELIDALASRQNADGSWVNTNARWMEGDRNLVTGYALLALSYCKK